MLDNITLQAVIIPPEEVKEQTTQSFYWRGLLFSPEYRADGQVAKYKATYRNLSFIILGNYLTIKNSIHKFYKGNNYSDFGYSDLCQATNQICRITGLEPKDFNVKKLEFGFNIPISLKPSILFSQVNSYKGKEFDNLRSKARIYGLKCILTEYNIKLYNKSEQVKITEKIQINPNLLRVEVQYNVMRKIPYINSLNDLLLEVNLRNLFSNLTTIFNNIIFRNSYDLAKLKRSRDRELLFAGQSIDFWNTEKNINKENYKKRRQRHKKIEEEVRTGNIKDELDRRLLNKFNELMGN